MTRESYFWNAAATGDAQLAPYTAQVYAKAKDIGFTGNKDYAVAEFSNRINGLNVTVNSATAVDVSTGTFVMDGLVGVVGVGGLTISSITSTGTGHWARIIIRVTWATSTVECVFVRGTALNPPTLTKNEKELYEISLARLWIPASGNAVQAKYIHDERVFGRSAYHDALYTTKNIMPNSEFIAPAQGRGGAPAMWHTFGSDVTVTSLLSPVNEQQRGRRVTITCDNASGAYSGAVTVAGSESRYVTVQFYIRVDEGEFDIYVDGGASVYRSVPVTNDFILVTIRNQFTSGAPTLSIYFAGAGTSNSCTIGQITATYGFVAAPFDPVPDEYIPFFTADDFLLASSAWASPTLLQSSLISPIRGVIAQLKANDSSSSTNDTCFATVSEYYTTSPNVFFIRLELGRVTDSYWRYGHGILYLTRLNNITNANNNPVAHFSRTAVGTLTAELLACGVITQ